MHRAPRELALLRVPGRRARLREREGGHVRVRLGSRPAPRGSGIRCHTSRRSKQDHQLNDIRPLHSFYRAVARDKLPAVSWVVPNDRVSEHPPGLISNGQSYVTGLINAIMRSPDWYSTAIFLSWDRLGRLLRQRVSAAGRSERLRHPRPRPRHQPVRTTRAMSTTRS